jgi:hypothetical protein
MSYRQAPDDRADMPPGPPPGWYQDPNGLPVLRWWDGVQWGPRTQPLPGIRRESQPQFPDAAPTASEGHSAFGQESADWNRQYSGLRDGTTFPRGSASGPYLASFPPAQPRDPYQPPQQPYVPELQPQAHRTPRRPGNRKVRDALIGLGTLIGIIIVITVVTGHRSSSSGNTAAPTSSPPSCISQLAAWRASGVPDVQAVATDMYNLGTADEALYRALTAGKAASAQEANLQTTAASVQADAQTAEANLPPSCIPNFRSDLRAGINDADKAGIDSGRAVSELTSGNYSVATEDVKAADKAENAGTAKIQAAAADLKAYGNG